ncbi:transposase IS4 family protein [Marine Group I thaumarchaeote SCGC AAA799-B03]|uniref:Transposase IS4 family protein n=1 Tax=Marine Group I thaumarchaeote SCGC AAA799-B03 TaxID=1502289 RepID=A0A087S833_9ARCH|nr:transposase IS4 family protein [Marine Group I thaumarchaeote SCGC AAA799-B03]
MVSFGHSMKNKYQRMISVMRQILKKMHIPLYLHTKSKHVFSVHQHIVMLVLRQYESKSYESFVEWLQIATEVTRILGLSTIPHYTTLQKAAARLSNILLHVAIGRFISIACPGKIFAGADATGFEDRHCTPYYTWRAQIRRSYTKLSAGSDMNTQLICAVVIQHHPVSHDVKHFSEIFRHILSVRIPWIMVLDLGYDAEWVHQMIRENNVLSMIPVRKRDCPIHRTHGRYRKQMRREFDESLYHQRNKCETIFSVIKRKFGSEIKSYNDSMKEKELLYRILAYNCHRMCMISCLLWMISRKPFWKNN